VKHAALAVGHRQARSRRSI